MQLKKLYANESSFHAVTFKDGVNLIVGTATEENKNDTQKTYNGVGKSLLIKLVDFCLACDSMPELKKLSGWEFTLEFEDGGVNYTSTRSTLNQSVIVLNGEEFTIKDFRKFFVSRVFKVTEQTNFLTWRTLISHFLRPRKESYIRFDTVSAKEKDYSKLLNVAYLLGIDIGLVQKKKELKSEFDRIDTFKKNVEGDDVFKKYFTQGKNVDIEIVSLEDSIKSLRSMLDSFEISESYYDIQKEADSLKNDGQQIKNRIVLLQNSQKQIDRSLEIKSDITAGTIIALYSEAKQYLHKNIIKTISDVSQFHSTLMTERKKRLFSERGKITAEIKTLERKRKEIGDRLDENLKFLGTHKALDEFVAVSEKLSTLTNSLGKLKSYKGLLQEYQNKTEEIEILLKEENISTNNYIQQAASGLIEENMNTFRLLSKRFYSDKAGGIEVTSNKGTNQIRFNIDVHIDDDVSDGVNEVKIFCFDLTLLLIKHFHSMQFVFHDSRLFSNMDPRQISTVFRLCNEYSSNGTFQYITTVNEDQLDAAKKHYTAKEYKKLIEDNKILTLTDESESSRLLGVKVNIDYEK
jgi:uncharacterized protein YydD (DUF2326 family)